jgi:hypothetical protein
MGFTVNAHYVNSGPKLVKVTMFVVRPGITTKHAGVLSFILTSISIPPTGQPYPVTGSCSIPEDVNVLWTGVHMHQRATQFVATSGATTLYQTSEWSEPRSMAFSPPLEVAANSKRRVDVYVRERHGRPARLRAIGADQRDVQLQRDLLIPSRIRAVPACNA